MKKLLTFLLTALLAFGVGWAADLTYTFTSTSAGTLTGAPTGVSASFTANANGFTSGRGVQLTSSKNTLTFTVKNFTSVYKLTGITLHYSTNASSGAGTLNARLGTNTNIASEYSLTRTGGTALRDAEMTVTETAFDGSDLVITVVASANSIYVNSFTITYAQNNTTPTCATPTFSPAEGTYTGAQNVTISCATSGSTIYYTTDGSTPTTNSSVYSAAIPVSTTTTINAMAIATGYNNSDVATATYTIDSAEPFTLVTDASTLNAGDEIIFVTANSASTSALAMSTTQNSNNRGQTSVTVNGTTSPTVRATTTTQILKLEGSSEGWYFKTVNGDNIGYLHAPTGSNNYLRTNSELVPTAKAIISIYTNGTNSINFVERDAYLRYNSGSSIFSCYGSNTSQGNVYIYRRAGTPTVATPTFSPAAGTYTSAQQVTISCETPGATIYYTTDGTDPTTSSAQYTGAINVNSTMTIKAIAVATGYDDSEVATATYNINLSPTLTATPSTLNINDDNTSGAKTGTFTVTGTNIGSDNVGVDVLWGNFSRNAGEYGWGFVNNNGSVSGTVAVTYTGRALSAHGRVQASNNLPISATVDVNYLYTGPIYIMGNVNSTGWTANNGVPMSRDASGNYSLTQSLLDSGDGYAYISFTKALGSNSNDWNTIAGDRFGPQSNGDWAFQETLVGQPCALDTTGGYWSIKLPAGDWEVTINPSTNSFTLVPHVPAPVFTPAGGRYETAQDVEITCPNADAHIYYTTDGTEPSASNGTLYNGPITVTAESTTIKAIAIYGNYSSEVTTATYTIKPIGADDFILVESTDDINAGDEYVLVRTVASTGVDHAMGPFNSGNYYSTVTTGFVLDDKVVTLDDPTTVNVLTLEDAGDGKFYIKDDAENYLYYSSGNNVHRNQNHDTNTNAYKWSLSINNNGDVVINNVNTTARYLQANPGATRYSCYENTQQNPKLYKKGTSSVPAPQITPAGGTSNKRFASFDVTITAADGCTIYYTTDGTNPTINSTEYTAPFELPYGSAPTTVKAIAVDGQGNVSRVTTVVYYWNRATVSISPASQRVTADVTVTITSTPGDADVTYKVNGGAEQAYSAPFTVQVNEENHSVTVVAIARKGESVATDTVTYTFKSDKVYSIAEFLALDNGEEVTFESPVTVLFDYSQSASNNRGQEYIWVKDRTGYTQFFLTPAIDHSSWVPKYENGDVIPKGFKVKKNYYSNGGYIQGYCSGDSITTFTTSTSKALADPEQVTLSELLNSIPSGSGQYSEYNNRYLYMNKVKIISKNGLNFTFAADENGNIVNGGSDVVGYNKYNDPAWKNKQGDVVGVTIPDVDDTYYNVKFIFQKWQGGYEIMPIEFTPWHENKVRLEDLVEIGEKNEQYTITNPLIAAKVTWDDEHGMFAIFAKDDEAYAHKRNPGNLKSYLIEYENGDFINTVAQEDYDQSNWIEILIPDTINTTPITSKSVGQYDYNSTLGALQELYENKILAGGTISGTYVDVLNPTIQMTHAPAEPTSASTYKPNIFCTGNFLMSNLDVTGAESGRNDEYGGQYFMMDAKPQEFAKVVWAYFEGTDDYFVAPAREGDDINSLDFKGGFLTDMSLCEEWGVTKQSHAENLFLASDDEEFGTDEALYSFNAIVRKNSDYWQSTGGNGAPRRILPKDDGVRDDTPAYIVYPLNSGDNSEVVTAVKEMNVNKVVDSMRYYNIMGQESKTPFEGINIVVTRYTDGTTSTAKILH